MADLSPAARAMMDAVMGQDAEPYPVIVATALRALADHQTQPRTQDGPLDHYEGNHGTASRASALSL